MIPALAVAAFLSLGLDWGQTLAAARAPARWREQNPLLGSHPSVGQVNTYFVVAAGATALGGAVLPARARGWWYGTVAALELVTILRNHAVGVRVSFRP